MTVGDDVFVRTWRRRETGWYGRAVSSARAQILVSGVAVEVVVEAAAGSSVDAVDAAYRAKYGAGGARSMVTAESAASTLLLSRAAAE